MVTFAPPQRRPILTDLDKELLAQLLQRSQTSQESYIRESALGVPWGSLANSLVGGMLVGRERSRARNLDEQRRKTEAALLRTYPTEVTEGMAVGDPIYSPGTDQYSTISAAPLVAGVEGQTRDQNLSNMLKNIGIGEGDKSSYIPLNEREVLQPRELTTGMTIEGSVEGKPNWVERNIMGEVGPRTYETRAEAISDVYDEPFKFSEYERNKKLEEQKRLRELHPQFKTQKTYYTSKGEPTVVNMFIDPKTNLPIYRGEVNELIDISNLSPDKPDLGENIEYTLTNEQRTEANNLGLNFPSNATVKFKFRKDFNPEGKSLQQLIANTVSQDWKQPLKDNITKIYTGKIPQTTLNKLSDTITNSFGELIQGAGLISSLRDIPVTGAYGEFVDVATGAGALIDGFTKNALDLENLLTQSLTGVTTEEFGALRTEMQLYLAASIEAITGEESGRYTAAEQKIAREALASKDIWKGSPGKAYGAIMQIMSIQELARDRAEILLAYEEAKQNNTEFVDPFPYTKENLKIYAQRLKRLGLDARTIKKVIKQSMLGREIIADYYNR
jgi:hypothetical protein